MAGVSIPSNASHPGCPGVFTDNGPLPAWMTRRQTGTMVHDKQPSDRRFHQLGRIIAILELGARAHGNIRWVHLYYALGFLPHTGLREPLQKHQQSVLSRLQARGTGDRYSETLDRLATELQKMAGAEPPHLTFDGLASQVLKAWGAGDLAETALPGPPLPADAVLYAQGYLEQRRELQANRPPAPPEREAKRYHWDYHLGRIMPWTGAGNDPNLTAGFRQGLADRRTLEPWKPTRQ